MKKSILAALLLVSIGCAKKRERSRAILGVGNRSTSRAHAIGNRGESVRRALQCAMILRRM